MNLVIIGAGGLAREVFDLAMSCWVSQGNNSIKGFLSDGPSDIEALGYPPVLSKVADYTPLPEDVFICAIGNVQHRKHTVEQILAKGGKFISLVHPTAIVSPSTRIGQGVVVKPYCTLSCQVQIGDFSYLQGSVIMGHDVQIGQYCQLNSFVFIAGNCTIGNQCILNAGARLIQSTIVEDDAIVGMGSVVLRKVKKGTTVFGNPARRVDF